MEHQGLQLANKAGLPPIVMQGKELRSCQGAMMLKELGISDLIARNEKEYVNLAKKLANDTIFNRQKRSEINIKMKTNPRFLDPKKFSQEIGGALQHMVQAQS